MAVETKGLYSIQKKDIFKGFLIAFGTALLPSIYDMLSATHFPTWIEFAPYLKAALSAGVVYLGKNYFSNNLGDFAKKDVPVKIVPKDAVVIPPQ